MTSWIDERGSTGSARLWRALVERSSKGKTSASMLKRWREKATSKLYAKERKREDRSDPLLSYMLSVVENTDTVLDVGAGIGRWAIPLAGVVEKVTALDLIPDMLEILKQHATQEGVGNIETTVGDWMKIQVGEYDHVLSSHAAYNSPDLLGYVRKMEIAARKTCFLVLRVPAADGVIGELSEKVHGQWHDSPNFNVGCQILLEAGIYPHVVMEEQMYRRWVDETLEAALGRAKKQLRLNDETHDELIVEVLTKRLEKTAGGYLWPDGMRSALLWWKPEKARQAT